MRVNPIEPIKADAPAFKGPFTPNRFMAPNTIHTRFKEVRPCPNGILMNPVPAEGVGEKLDIIA